MRSDSVLGIVHKLQSLYVTHADTNRKQNNNCKKMKLAIYSMFYPMDKTTFFVVFQR